jgi:hypothetical protein
MGFLKRITDLFFREGSAKPDTGTYAYVRIKRTGEVVRVRMMKGYDISQNDEGRLFSRKVVMGTRGFDQVECTFYFNKDYKLVDAEIGRGGEWVDEEDYLGE